MKFCWKDTSPVITRQPSSKIELRRWLGFACGRVTRWRKVGHWFLYALLVAVGVEWTTGRRELMFMLWPRFSAAEGENLFHWRFNLRWERIPQKGGA